MAEGNTNDCTQAFSMADLMKMIVEKDRLITSLLSQGAAGGTTVVPSFQVMPDLSKSIADFTGEGDASEAREWIECVESAATLHKWPEEFKLETAKGHLKGPAKDWHIDRRHLIRTWDDFNDRFRRTFVSQTSAAERWRRMQERTQQRGESTVAYFHEKAKLCGHAKLEFFDTREQIIVGLRSKELCSMLMGRTHDDLDDLLHDVREFERIERERQARFGGQSRHASSGRNDWSSTSTPERKSEEQTDRRDRQTTESLWPPGQGRRPIRDNRPPLKNDQGEPKCYNCSCYGHIARDCPQPPRPKKCLRCREVGHTQRHCPASTGRREESNSVDARDEKLPGILLKEVLWNGRDKLVAMIDTGSSSCLLRASAAVRCGVEVAPDMTPLFGLGHRDKPATWAIGRCRADLTVDGVVGRDVDVLIVPDEVQPVDLLVGRSYTELPHIAYIRVDSCLKFGYRDEEPFRDLQLAESETRLKLAVSKNVEVERKEVQWVTLSASNNYTGPAIFSDGRHDILLEMKCGELTVPVASVWSDRVVLRAGDRMGRVEPVDVFSEDEGEAFLTELVPGKHSEPSRTSEKRQIQSEELRVGPSVTQEQKHELLQLVNEYRDCVALSLPELGCTTLTKMEIIEKPGSTPVASRPYRTSAEERENIKDIVKEWRENGIVTDTRSPYASPVLLVKKKNGDKRLVVDFRKLNQQTVREKYPLPNIDDQLSHLSGSKMFAVLDLAHGYLQIPLSEEAKDKTAFITPDETGRFERMIFGLTNAPCEFQRLMNRVLGPLRGKTAMCYLDDILIPASEWTELMSRLRSVLEALRKANLTLRLSKCAFGMEEIEFLGFVISNGQVRPGRAKVKAIAEFVVPRNVHEVRRFLGLTGFFRRFIRNYAVIAEPLTELTKKDVPFAWKEKQQCSFQELKHKLVSDPVLKLYDPQAETELHTDASADGLAGMLLQKDASGNWRLVFCVSKRTTEAERNYHSSKLELMAVVWAVDRLRPLLLGIHFTLVTDCQALMYMNVHRTQRPQIARWCDMIQEFDFSVRHRPGVKMAHVDALSRLPVEDPSDTMEEILTDRVDVYLTLSVDDQVRMVQQSDPTLMQLVSILEKPKESRTPSEQERTKNYVFKEGKLFWVKGGKRLFVMPAAMRKSLCVKYHNLQGHFGVDRTVARIEDLFWFPRMRRYVRRHIASCFECLLSKTPTGKAPGLLHPIEPGRRPFATVHMDHVGPFVPSSRRNQWVLVIIDNMTKFVRLYPVLKTDTKNVLASLKSFIIEFGLPERIISDRGSCFTSRQFQEFCQERGIHHTLNSTQHPRANGQVERVNRTLVPVIIASIENPQHKDWDGRIREVECHLNTAFNKATGTSPFRLLHGYQPRHEEGLLRWLNRENDEWTPPEQLQDIAKAAILREQGKSKKYFDKGHYCPDTLKVGDIVAVRCVPEHTGNPTKTQRRYRGPLLVTEVLPCDTYRITKLDRDKKRVYATTAHISRLKLWQPEDEEAEDETDVSSEDDNHKQRSTGRIRRRPYYLKDYDV